MIEQLYATELRVAAEASLLSGTAAGDWWAPPVIAAAVARTFVGVLERKDVWRQRRTRIEYGNSWEIATSHPVGVGFLGWLLSNELEAVSGETYLALTPETQSRTYVLEVESQAGDRQRFSGMAIQRIALQWQERRLVGLDVTWVALHRTTSVGALPAADQIDEAERIPTWPGKVALTTGAWGADPREDNGVTSFDAQLFMSRDIAAADFGPGMEPLGHAQAPWRVLAETTTQQTALMETAFSSRFAGRMGIWIGPAAHFRLDNAQGFVRDEELKASDWRQRRIGVEGFSDNARRLLTYHPS